RDGGRPGAGCHAGDPRRRPARVHGPAAAAGASARPRRAARVPAPPADHEIGIAETQQSRRRHGNPGAARTWVDAGAGGRAGAVADRTLKLEVRSEKVEVEVGSWKSSVRFRLLTS